MEVLMRNDTLNVGKVCICRSFWLSKNKLGIENIQPFVLHCAHIEIAYRHNHEAL